VRFLSGRALSLSHTFYDDESILTVPSVAVTVRLDGASTDVFTGDATGAEGVWTVAVPALEQGAYTVTWNAGLAVDKTRVEVVGGVTFTISEARSSDVDLTSAEKFPAAEIRGYRDVIEQEFETITGRSFTPRTRQFTFISDGNGLEHVGLHDVNALSATVDGAETDASGWAYSQSGFLSHDAVEGAVVVLTADYGFRFCPDDVKRAAMIRLRTVLAGENSGIPDRATSFIAAEGGTFTLATPGKAGSETGIPEVDTILGRYRYRLLNGIA
jgi:hypothetical protein